MKIPTQSTWTKQEALVKIPLSAVRYLSRYPREKKMLVEISTEDLRRVNRAETIDEIISEARLDYARGDFTTHASASRLLADLKS